ncbi:MAG: zinc ribbon domain-containing protein [Caldilineaceae bacterium]|nr:zinc ribbon domain-containing protein [Caldilineaceae bacterium]MCB9139329.1 zinc ribbon domain-containing protein [Caldilineaceae bacterium]
MPLYEYACHECGEVFEKLVSMSKADAPQVCPACGGGQSRRKLSSFAVSGGGRSSGGSMPAPVSSPFT